ncbi:MAG: FecCD family ABC transporter permease [Kiritimatiellia bacterium]
MTQTPRQSLARLVWLVLLALVVPCACVFLGPEGFGLPDLQTPIGRALLTLRLHRIATGFVVGAALAVSGAVFQAVLRNPLADPYVLGISGGGALGAAIAILFGWYAIHPMLLPLNAFVGAGVTLIIVYALAAYDGAPTIYGLILSGVIVSAMASSLLMLLLSLSSVEGLHSVTWWTLGNLQGSSPQLLAACALCSCIGIAASAGMARDLNALALGAPMAHHLGVRPDRTAALALAAATLAAAAAVALAGLIGFVGLIVPHAMRHWIGADHRRLIWGSALGGGTMLVLCDTLARLLMAPRELPVGVITALVGGPFFLVLLRVRRQQWSVG